MTVNEIRKLAENKGWYFDTYHDFTGIHDRYIENHDRLLSEERQSIVIAARILKSGRSDRSKWHVIKLNATEKATILTDYISLEEAMEIANTK